MTEKKLPAWANPTPPEEAKKITRDQVLPPVRVTAAEMQQIKELAARHYGGNMSKLIRDRALGNVT